MMPTYVMTRIMNIGLRTAHIGVSGVLVGGHVFGMEAGRLFPWLFLTLGSGGALLFVEAFPDWRWCGEGRGLLILLKLLLLLLVPWLWDWRVSILMAVIAIGSVGSHMPRKLRHYSILEHRVVERDRHPNSQGPAGEAP